jgi:hypothetical protein
MEKRAKQLGFCKKILKNPPTIQLNETNKKDTRLK